MNNNEMGILIRRSEDAALYKDAYEEAQRVIRISDEVRISVERVAPNSGAEKVDDKPAAEAAIDNGAEAGEAAVHGKLSSSKLAQKLGLKTADLLDKFAAAGYLVMEDGKQRLTPKATDAGCEFVARSRFGPYFLWPESLRP